MNMQEDKSIIEVSHVSKFFGEKTALDDVTLNVKKGEFVTILGQDYLRANGLNCQYITLVVGHLPV